MSVELEERFDTDYGEALAEVVLRCNLLRCMFSGYDTALGEEKEFLAARYLLRIVVLETIAFEEPTQSSVIMKDLDSIIIELSEVAQEQKLLIGEPITIGVVLGLATAVAGLASVSLPLIQKFAPKIVSSGLEANEFMKSWYITFLCNIKGGKNLAALLEKITTILYAYNGRFKDGYDAITAPGSGIDRVYRIALGIIERKKALKTAALEADQILQAEDTTTQENNIAPQTTQ